MPLFWKKGTVKKVDGNSLNPSASNLKISTIKKVFPGGQGFLNTPYGNGHVSDFVTNNGCLGLFLQSARG